MGIAESAVLTMLSYLVSCAVIYRIGRVMNGQGSLYQVMVAISWNTLLIAAFSPVYIFLFYLVYAQQMTGFTPFLLAASIIYVWVYLQTIREVHQFDRIWPSIAILGAIMLILITLIAIVESQGGGA